MRKQIILRQVIMGFCLFNFVVAMAQTPTQYLHFNAGGGLHTLNYDMPNGIQKAKAGYTLNAAYAYFFTPNWGVQGGLGIQSFGAQSTLNYFTEAADVDAENDAYLFRTLYTNWQEKQHAFMLNVPVAVQYRYALNSKISLAGSAGFQLGMPLSAKYKSVGGSITTTGYYSTWNVELADIPEQGLSTTTDSYKGKIGLKPSVVSTLDLGAIYKLNEKIDLYLGAYFNYGLGEIEKADTKLIYEKGAKYNGMFASNQVTGVRPVAFGLKLGVYLPMGKQNSTVEIASQPQIVEAPMVEETPIVVEQPVVEEAPVVVEQPIVYEAPAVVVETPKPAPDAPKKEVPVDQFKEMQKIASSLKISFDLNSVEPISKINNQKFKTLINYLKSNPRVGLQIIGNTCNTGTRRNNMILGTKRAIEIQQKLIKQGAPRAQLSTLSQAYDKPLVPNTSEANRKKNRRVEFNLIRK